MNMCLMKLFTLILICCTYHKIVIGNMTINTEIEIAKTSTDTISLVVSAVELIINNKIVSSLLKVLGPVGLAIGIVGDIVGLLNQKPDVSDLLREQTEFINECFTAMSNQVIF